MSVILVGERWNLAPLRRRVTHAQWLKIALRHPCFSTGLGRSKMGSIGVRWSHGANLTPPAKQDVPFDSAFGDQVAAMIRDDSYWRILCCGRRVAACFGLPGTLPYGLLLADRYIVLPHPSGRCRVWNNQRKLNLIREMVSRALDPVTCEGGERCRTCRHPLDPTVDTTKLCPRCESLSGERA